ncbi:MAG: permease [Planctomycetales bacterium]
MLEAMFWGFCLRFLQSLLQGAPFIFTGLCIMGMLHRLMGHQITRRVFGSNSIQSQFQSWLIGMLLPGCSLGCIPIVKQLRRSGISVGTIFAFALSSPLFDPLSLLYGLTLSKPMTIMAFACGSLVVVTVSGTLFDRMFPSTEVQVPEPPPVPYGVRRLLSILVVMAREAVSGTAILILVGLAGSAFLSILLPIGSLQRTMAHDNPWSPLLMTGLSIPAYATPMVVMSQLGSMFQHGNSVGAAFILLIFGAGMNMGLLTWMVLNYGWKKAGIWFAIMISIVVGLSYGIERPLYPRDIQPADHTHAFDRYCSPFSPGAPPGIGYPAEIERVLRMETQLHEKVGFLALAGLVCLGLGLKVLDRKWVIENWLARATPAAEGSKRGWDIVVPGPVLAMVGFAAIVVFSLLGCFAYYPSPDETLEELKVAQTEALSAALGKRYEHALHWIPICEGWNRRLQVGVYLRRMQLSEYHRMKSRVFQDRLEVLDHMMENHDSPELIQKQVNMTSSAFRHMAAAYREELE